MGFLDKAGNIDQQGAYYKKGDLKAGGVQSSLEDAIKRGNQESQAMRDAGLARSMGDYSQGDLSLQDMLAQAGQGEYAAGRMQEFATNPLAAGRFAQEQTGQGPLTGQLFGADDSVMSRNIAGLREAEEGMNRYDPTEAAEYGRARADITRGAGQQEQALAQAMAQRGMTQSGAAGAAFTGAMGNKFEQLSNTEAMLRDKTLSARRDNRNQLQNYQTQLMAHQQAAINSQLGSQFKGREASEGARAQRMGEMQAGGELELARNEAGEELTQQSLASKIAAKTPSIGEAMGRGWTTSMQKTAESPGRWSDSFSDASGSALGGMSTPSGGGGKTEAPKSKNPGAGGGDPGTTGGGKSPGSGF